MAGEISTSGCLGIDVDLRDTIPQFPVGNTVWGVNDAESPLKMIYVVASGAVGAGESAISVSVNSVATSGGGSYSNSEAFADGEYGWVWDEAN